MKSNLGHLAATACISVLTAALAAGGCSGSDEPERVGGDQRPSDAIPEALDDAASGVDGNRVEETAGGDGGAVTPDARASGVDARADVRESANDGSAPGPAKSGFVCSHVFGGNMVMEWFPAFEKLLGTASWQAVGVRGATPDSWVNPASGVWRSPPTSPCAMGSGAPDRVVYYAASFLSDGKLNTAAGWKKVFVDVVAAIRTKYPTVTRIDLLTIHRGPANAVCGGDSKTSISALEDAAIAAVAAANPGLVFAAPAFEFPSCSHFDGHHYAPQGDAHVVNTLASYFR